MGAAISSPSRRLPALAVAVIFCLAALLPASTASAADSWQFYLTIGQSVTGEGASQDAQFAYALTPDGGGAAYDITLTGTQTVQAGPVTVQKPGVYTYSIRCTTLGQGGYVTDSRAYNVWAYVLRGADPVVLVSDSDGNKIDGLNFAHSFVKIPDPVGPIEPADPDVPPGTDDPTPGDDTPDKPDAPDKKPDKPKPKPPKSDPSDPGSGSGSGSGSSGSGSGSSGSGSTGSDSTDADATDGAITEATEATPSAVQDTAGAGEDGDIGGNPAGTRGDAEANNGSRDTLPGFSARDMERLDAQTGNPFVDLARGNVAWGSLSTNSTWSLLNALLAIAALAITALYAAFAIRRKEWKYAKRAKALAASVLASGLATILFVVITTNLSQPMTWITKWTPIAVVLFAVLVVLANIPKARARED
jgi:hypothetical protein